MNDTSVDAAIRYIVSVTPRHKLAAALTRPALPVLGRGVLVTRLSKRIQPVVKTQPKNVIRFPFCHT